MHLRSPQTRVDAAVAALRAEFPGSCVSGTACDVTDPRDVDAFGDYAASTVGVIHRWLNNAGMVSSRETLLSRHRRALEVIQVCNTNLTGAILCCQKAVRLMQAQPAAGKSNPPGATPQSYHVYNTGFSAWGASFSKSTCTHKATKRGLSQLTQSLSEELVEAGVDAVGIHQLSPGMVLTDLLLEGANPVAKRFFNVLAEEPETVAADVVPKVRATAGTNTSVEFLTLPDAVRRVVFGVPQILGGGRFFDGRETESRGGRRGTNQTGFDSCTTRCSRSSSRGIRGIHFVFPAVHRVSRLALRRTSPRSSHAS